MVLNCSRIGDEFSELVSFICHQHSKQDKDHQQEYSHNMPIEQESGDPLIIF
jgi:hypothetical protein